MSDLSESHSKDMAELGLTPRQRGSGVCALHPALPGLEDNAWVLDVFKERDVHQAQAGSKAGDGSPAWGPGSFGPGSVWSTHGSQNTELKMTRPDLQVSC